MVNKKSNQSNLSGKKITVIMCIVSLLLIVGVGFAFFSATIVNTNNERLSTETATLSLKFDDNDNGISGNLNLGESITKKFTLQNTGTLDAYAKINWYNLVNTYINGSLTYNLEQSTSENGTYTSIDNSNVPVSSIETTETLKNGILVPVNTTYYYKLTITFNNLENVNQNSDINATFYSYFSLEEGSLSGADKIKNLVAGANTNSTDVITKETPSGATCTNTLAYDGTADNNLRYVGLNPCNYVTFNGETAGWRIIGIMNNVDDGTGNKETRIKLIRRTPLGNYSWDSSNSNVNYGMGINDWTQADLMRELNNDYLNITLSANTYWYNGINNLQTEVFDYTKVLSARTQELIRDASWNLGGHEYDIYNVVGEGTTSKLYMYERGTEVVTPGITCSGTYCNDEITRSTKWTGKVALMYPSDYGFAVGGEVRNLCLNKNLNTYNESNCHTNNWIYVGNTYQWFLSPNSSYANTVFLIDNTGNVSHNITNANYAVSPTIYLKSGVFISGGNGTESEPYILE